MARTLLCEIVTPERIVYTNEVEMVVAPTLSGEVGILPLHTPMVAALKPGEVHVKYGTDQTEWFAIAGGYLQVHEDKVIILADDAAISSQIDVDRARQSRALAEQKLAEVRSGGQGDAEMLERELYFADAQLAVATKR
jgi:F-type H+-transporting ATPase subunit epsilon